MLLFFQRGASSRQLTGSGTDVRNRVYFRTGIEPSLLSTAGYQHRFIIPTNRFPLTVFGEYTMPPTRPSVKNSETAAGALFPLFEYGSFMVADRLNATAGFIETHNFNSTEFSAADEISAGYNGKRWFLAGTAEYEKILLTRIEHTDFYRRTSYEDARDGWYYGSGGIFQFGVRLGFYIYDSVDITLEMKVPFTEKFNSYAGSPLHGSLSTGYRF